MNLPEAEEFDRNSESTDNFFRYKRRRETDGLESALTVFQQAVIKSQLDSSESERAGRLIRRDLSVSSLETKRALVLGQCTTSWLCNLLTVYALGQGIRLRVSEGGYDNVMQEMLSLRTAKSYPDVLVLIPWSKQMLSPIGGETSEARAEFEIEFWQRIWGLAQELGIKVLQVGYDLVTAGPMGTQLGGTENGDLRAVRMCNALIRERMPKGTYFADLDFIAGETGRKQFYDPRRYYWTKQPFSELGAAELARHLASGVRTLLFGAKKVLVVDLDNTLWGGVVGELGPHGIALGDSPEGEAFLALQHQIKKLGDRGVVLAICSKNNEEDIKEVFTQNRDMVLSHRDFAATAISWEPKAVGLQALSDSLSLDLESFVFLDDNPAERAHIRQLLPQVSVVELPPDPAEYGRALDDSLFFETTALTEADLNRGQQYQNEGKRRLVHAESATLEDYLLSLQMRASIAQIDESTMQRVMQLIGKTNQFNLTSRRHTREGVERLLAVPGAIGLTMDLEDDFGGHGLVSVLIAVPESTDTRSVKIDTWLMSCRVIGRTAEQFMFNTLCGLLQENAFERVIGEYEPTNKNGQVAGLYPSLGFTKLNTTDGGIERFELVSANQVPAITYISDDRVV